MTNSESKISSEVKNNRHSSMRSYMTDHRTPIAWKHRDMTLHGHHNHNHNHGHHRHHYRHRSPPSPTVTTSSSDEREEVPMVRSGHHHLRRPNSRYGQYSQFSAAEAPFHTRPAPYRGGGTLRSTRSVPALALATWDGEPCPVHGHGMPPPPLFHAGTMRRHGSLSDVRPPALFGPPPGPLMDKKSFHGSMQLLNPPWYAPPIMRTRPLVIPAPAEPLPIRDPFRRNPGYPPSKLADDSDYDQVCCKGHLIVLWIILGVVTVGVVLGIVLGVTIA